MSSELEFQGKTILVTGAGAGIGKATSKRLAAAGASIIAVSLVREELEELKKEIPGVRTIQVDLGDWDATRKALSNLGPVHGLVNNVGIASPMQLFLKVTPENFDRTFNLNVKTLINVSQVVVESMMQNGIKGSIVNIASIAGKMSFPGLTVYCATKASVISITKTMAKELSRHEIRVNCVSPTLLKTNLSRELWENEELCKVCIERTPLGRLGLVEEIANGVAFLLSDRASLITATDLGCDGGILS